MRVHKPNSSIICESPILFCHPVLCREQRFAHLCSRFIHLNRLTLKESWSFPQILRGIALWRNSSHYVTNLKYTQISEYFKNVFKKPVISKINNIAKFFKTCNFPSVKKFVMRMRTSLVFERWSFYCRCMLNAASL